MLGFLGRRRLCLAAGCWPFLGLGTRGLHLCWSSKFRFLLLFLLLLLPFLLRCGCGVRFGFIQCLGGQWRGSRGDESAHVDGWDLGCVLFPLLLFTLLHLFRGAQLPRGWLIRHALDKRETLQTTIEMKGHPRQALKSATRSFGRFVQTGGHVPVMALNNAGSLFDQYRTKKDSELFPPKGVNTSASSSHRLSRQPARPPSDSLVFCGAWTRRADKSL